MTAIGRTAWAGSIYSFNVSLDGYIETVDKSLDWSLISDEVHGYFNDQTRALDASLYGRRLWDLMSAHWPTAEDDPDSNEVMRDFARVWNATPKIVFSRTLDHVDHGARLAKGDVGDELAKVRREFDGDLERRWGEPRRAVHRARPRRRVPA